MLYPTVCTGAAIDMLLHCLSVGPWQFSNGGNPCVHDEFRIPQNCTHTSLFVIYDTNGSTKIGNTIPLQTKQICIMVPRNARSRELKQTGGCLGRSSRKAVADANTPSDPLLAPFGLASRGGRQRPRLRLCVSCSRLVALVVVRCNCRTSVMGPSRAI